jgi:hypothetical protein
MEIDEGTITGKGTVSGTPTPQHKGEGKGKERAPPIKMTATVNLLKFQAEIKAITSVSFEFLNTRNDIRVIAREKADYSAVIRHFEAKNVPFFQYHPKALRPVKATIRQLAGDTPAEDISNELVALGFSFISMRQMTSSKQHRLGCSQLINLPLFW